MTEVPVDRLEYREAPAGLEHPEEFVKSLLLGLDVYEHGTGGDRINRGVPQGDIIGGGQEEPAPVKRSHLLGYAAAVLKQVQRDVAEDDPARRPYLGHRTEGY